MASPNLSEIITTTARNRNKKLADSVSKNNALLNRLEEKGNVKPFSGGRTIIEEIDYQENANYTRYAGNDVIGIAPSDVITAAEFDIKQAALSIQISGLEQLQNAGPEQLIDLLEARFKNGERTMRNNISLDCYSDGTASTGKQIGGLKTLVSSTPTSGTVGGINRATWTFWRNVASTGNTFSSTLVGANMDNLWVQLIRGKDHPDLIIADNTAWSVYLQSLVTIQRITTDKAASQGFSSLEYMGGLAQVVLDGGFGGGMPSSQFFFLNTDYIFLRPHRERNFEPIGGDRFSTNQDAVIQLVGWAGNMTMSNAFLQGVQTT
jgi:hypothetical protein